MSRTVRRRVPFLVGLAVLACWVGCSPTPPSCVYSLSRTSVSIPPGGGSDSVSVTTGSGCAWSAAASASWLAITSGGSGAGSGTIGFSAPANGPSARSATLTVAGQVVAVSQDGVPAPTYVLSGNVSDTFIGPPLGISGVSVSVSGGASPGSATTDFAGDYTIAGLLAGTYTVTFAKASYLTGTASIAISGPASLSTSLSLDVPATPSAANLTGYWSGTGSYPNDPFKLALIQNGGQLRGMYVDQHDASLSISGTYSSPELTLRVDFGDAVLFLECVVEDARDIGGVQRTSALGNRPYPFKMRR